ncbi:MAG: CE1 family esterase [Armatimonadota bacterium]
MSMRRHWWLLTLALLAVHAAAEPLIFKVTVDDVERQALVFPGKKASTAPSPLVFAFHGFGGSSLSMAATKIHKEWPEATVVYPLGLPAWSNRMQKFVPAWQGWPGRDNDRDVAFIDVLLADLQQTLKVDARRVYATGISNGALFCYILLLQRPQVFAGFACLAGAADFVSEATVPKPVLIIQGKKDTTVKPDAAIRTRDLLRKLNGCGEEEKEWANGYISYHPCTQPVIWRLHNGGHNWPGEGTKMVVKFFKEVASD